MNNIERIKAGLDGSELDAILLTSVVNRLFATGFNSSAGAVLITKSGAWFFTDSRYEEAASKTVTAAEVILVRKQTEYFDRINKIITRERIKAVGFEERTLSYAEYQQWSEKLSAGLVPMQKLLDDLRAVKSRDDLTEMIRAQRISEKAFEEILPLVGKGLTEREAAAELTYRMMRNGADDKSFDPIIVSGTRSSMPHGVPGDTIIGEGFVTIDFGVKLGGWCSDTTRTLCVGAPAEEMVKVYDTVLAAQTAGINAAKAGVSGKAIDSAAREVIEKAGYGKYFGHGFGHGLGYEVHEPPNASPNYDGEIPAGAVISAEPGIYIPGKFGVRIEDVLYITTEGCENITKITKRLIIV